MLRHPSNRGYGASQKTGYVRALKDGAAVVVMVHADNQYDPGLVAEMAAPILAGDADVVIGSRLLDDRAIAGGMPRWKWVGNRLLTGIENRAFGVRFSEYHTGYRAFSGDFLRSIPFLRNSDDFVFDQEIFAQMLARQGARGRDPDPDALLPRGVLGGLRDEPALRVQDAVGARALPARPPLGTAAPARRMARRGPYVAILLAALAIRVVWVLATPDYTLVHDAVDYDRHAAHLVADGTLRDVLRARDGVPAAGVSARRWRACTRSSASGEDRIEWARLVNALIGTGIVALIGVIARQLWGRREALAAMALGAVYMPLIEVGQAVMSEPLFALLMLGAIACALRRWVILAGLLLGLAILARANGMILVLPLAWAVWERRARGGGRRCWCVVAALTVIPWTIRNYARARPLRAGLDPVRLRHGRHLQRPGAARSGEPGVVAVAAPHRELDPLIGEHPRDQRGGARPGAAERTRSTTSRTTRGRW